MLVEPRSYSVVKKIRAAREALERMRPAKMEAALEALKRRYHDTCAQVRGTRKHGQGKRLLAQLAFEAYYIANRQELRESQLYDVLTCDCKIDRVVVTASDVSLDAIAGIPGYERKKPRPLWGQSYRVATPINGSGSVRHVVIESERTKPCFPRYRIVIEPRDDSGLQAQDLTLILGLLTAPKIQLAEVAFDFPFGSVVDTEFVENHGVFGKSNPRRVGRIPAYDSWGSRKSAKLVKSYFKAEISAHRVELEVHAPDLRRYGINDAFGFQKFAKILPGHHIFFGKLNHPALVRQLVRDGFSPEQIRAIRNKVRNLEWNLSAALSYLRKDVGLTNVRRILTPLNDVNLVVRQGLEKCLAQWPARPTRPGKKP
jgi:hypothetical protein